LRQLQGGNERFLETIGSICVVSQQSVSSFPDQRSVFFDNYLPVNNLQTHLLLALPSVAGYWQINIIVVSHTYFITKANVKFSSFVREKGKGGE
jgi:hypothetical protein